MKNAYGNTVGYHTPQKTEEFANIINKGCKVQFVDGSWHNDVCDSLHHEISDNPHKYIEVYLPNSENEDINNEEYNTFSLFDEDQNELFNGTDIKELIKFINNNY